jgi:excisionase family DNA binding protein
MVGEQRFVSVVEAAQFFRVHKMTLYRMLEHSSGTPGAFKVGRSWRLDVAELERYLEAGKIQHK